jgi:hypothetical protein
MKQTAVEWLIIQMHTHWTNEDVTFQTLLEQAKEIEKEQIIEAYDKGEFNQGCNGDAEQYFNETFKKE